MSKVTTEQVSQWVGNGFNVGFFNSREEALLEIITDVANRKYGIAELNADIRSYEWLVYILKEVMLQKK